MNPHHLHQEMGVGISDFILVSFSLHYISLYMYFYPVFHSILFGILLSLHVLGSICQLF